MSDSIPGEFSQNLVQGCSILHSCPMEISSLIQYILMFWLIVFPWSVTMSASSSCQVVSPAFAELLMGPKCATLHFELLDFIPLLLLQHIWSIQFHCMLFQPFLNWSYMLLLCDQQKLVNLYDTLAASSWGQLWWWHVTITYASCHPAQTQHRQQAKPSFIGKMIISQQQKPEMATIRFLWRLYDKKLLWSGKSQPFS